MTADPFLPARILMTTDTVGGVWQYSLDLSQALGLYGIDVELATMGKPLTAEQWEAADAIPNLTIHESSYRLEWMDDPWEEVDEAGVWLQKLARDLYPDLIHFNHFSHANLEWLQPTLVVVHSDVASWWRAVRGEELPPHWNYYHKRVSAGLQAADVVIAPSLTMLDSARKDYGPFKRQRVIPNGRDPSRFQPKRKQHFILTMGRIWDEAKNIRMLDEIASDLEWPVYAAGNPNHPDGGEQKLSNLQFMGELSQDALSEYLATASIYVMPAKYEPFGLSILEAAFNSCALILGNIPSLRENWEGAAIFVPPEDPRALQVAIESLISDPNRLEELGRLAKERARTFTIRNSVERYIQEYRHLLHTQLPLSQDQFFRIEKDPSSTIQPGTLS